jgi:DNA-directed RNA polymerase specialized sigma24 family protein
MADGDKQKARKNLQRAQANFERKLEDARTGRRESFERAQEAGLSLREIAAEVGLHWTRVGEILRGK